MRVCIYGTQTDRQMLLSAANESKLLFFRQYEADWYDNYDTLIGAIKGKKYDLTISMKDNADGMEGVIAVKSLFPEMPVIWFSNDKDFGTQSYRLGTDYFHTKPITANVLEKALQKCLITNRI